MLRFFYITALIKIIFMLEKNYKKLASPIELNYLNVERFIYNNNNLIISKIIYFRNLF